jgi:hypothetical protein
VEGYWKVVKYLDQNIDSTQLVKNYYVEPVQGDDDWFPCGKKSMTTTRDWILRFRFDPDGRYEKDSTYNWRYSHNFKTSSQQHEHGFTVANIPGLPGNPSYSSTRKCQSFDTLFTDRKVITKGFWMFAGGTNDIKNKERMFLTDGEDQYEGVSYDILQLRDKEMKLVWSVSIPLTMPSVIDPTIDSIVGSQVRKIQYNMEQTDPFGEGD